MDGTMNVGIDMMGGDYAPQEAVKGVKEYIAEQHGSHNTKLYLIGDEATLQPQLDASGVPSDRYTLVPASQVIGMHEHPARALKEKQDSSIAKGFGLLATKKIDAFIGAGNTGAMLAGTMFTIKPIQSVIRPTISTIIPRENGKTGLLVDAGINVDSKPEMLNQFATLGAAYAQYILGVDNPTVGLINVGEEEGKGNQLAQAAYPLLKSNHAINFIGNVEGRDILDDKADVLVCDGFTGNILLKLLETLDAIAIRQQIDHPFFKRFGPEQYGGTPILGVQKPVIIGHGNSHAEAFKNMVLLAEKMLQTNLLQHLEERLQIA
jgi:phosphate acyltransferase